MLVLSNLNRLRGAQCFSGGDMNRAEPAFPRIVRGRSVQELYSRRLCISVNLVFFQQSKLRSSVEIVDSPSMHCHHPSIAVSASGPVKTENPLCRDMPSPLPVTSASVSPVPTLQTSSIAEPVSEGSLNESIESIPPPLQIGTTGEPDVPPRQSLRLRIKLTKSGGTAVETVRPSVIKITGKDVDGNLVCSTLSIQDNSSGIVRVRSAPEVTEVRPSRVSANDTLAAIALIGPSFRREVLIYCFCLRDQDY